MSRWVEPSGYGDTTAAMPPKIEPGTPTLRVQIIAPKTWVERIDEWRRRQAGTIPSRSEAIRFLVTRALALKVTRAP